MMWRLAWQADWCMHVSAEQFYAINFAGMLLFKMGIILFNLVPLIAVIIG
jgi:hypothetical protein